MFVFESNGGNEDEAESALTRDVDIDLLGL